MFINLSIIIKKNYFFVLRIKLLNNFLKNFIKLIIYSIFFLKTKYFHLNYSDFNGYEIILLIF